MFSKENRKKFSFLRAFWILALILFFALVTPAIRLFFFGHLGRWLYILLFAFSTAALLTPLMMFIADKVGIVDAPGGRKIHTRITPLLGGVAIIISFISALLANMILDARDIVLIAGGTVMAIVGLIDDWKSIPARYKLFVQVCVVIVLIRSGIILDLFPVHTTWGYFLNAALSIIWIVGLTNAMNFIDGMDGLATGVSAIMSLFMGIVAFQTHQPFMGWIAIAMLGGCLGFLPFNFSMRKNRQASIFLGDAGSTFFGFVLSSLAIKAAWADNNPIVSFATPILIFWVLIYDMAYISLGRIITGKVKSFQDWIDYVGTDHIHHRLLVIFGDRRKVVFFIFFLCATLGISAVTLRGASTSDGILTVVQAFLITVIVSILEYSGRNQT
ncbi:MAG: undecaprenyl/decaprenyl-phosphate alpha-N-acetylglucosaminyl 1-phosphate transferase [Deltaproteobacteria bacterium]|nr:undecaprenyl/decaprenyl-phosphate alpha-N-acetylglucosaminyl 1-phosphate transferase [Deltaproteobacteria bacterium]